MTPEQKQIAIAKECGWVLDKNSNYPPNGGSYSTHKNQMEGVPDYLNDLNAMHEAEKTLTPEEIVDYCNFRLRFTTGEGCVTDYKMIMSTASQRADAFLLTKGYEI